MNKTYPNKNSQTKLNAKNNRNPSTRKVLRKLNILKSGYYKK